MPQSGRPAQGRHWVLRALVRRGEIVGADDVADLASIPQPPAMRKLRGVDLGRRQPPKP